uniref:CSON014531 protein n=1 Tax=Culicoides sonorensis TaxID=179676 RepID=A0A336MAR8_CULSO
MRIAFYLNFVLISLKINLNHAENVELIVRNGRIWWPLGCLVYGAPMLDESSGNGILFGSEDTNISDVKFILFSKISTDRDEIILVDDLVSIMKSKFNPLLPTKFLIHGWRDNSTNAMMQVTKNGYFARSSLNNVIGVDWGPLADSLNYPMVAQTDNSFISVECADFDELRNENCSKIDNKVQMGGYNLVQKKAKGLFYLKTNDKSPFSL